MLYEEIRSYISGIAPDQVEIVKLYKGKQPIFEHFGIEKQIKSGFGKTVTMANGAHLIVEHTGSHARDRREQRRARTRRQRRQPGEQRPAGEPRRRHGSGQQLRLRDMGGIIVVDFIDLHNPNNRKALYEKLRTEMKRDRAKHTILPPSKFGLVQITRQRVRPETNITTVEKCPACEGTGEIKASIC